MQKSTLILILTIISNYVQGQSNYDKFKELFEKNDTVKIKTLLTNWEKSNPNDPELYTSAFNYYFVNSKKEVLSLQKEAPKQEGYQLTDSNGNVAGFLTSAVGYDPDKLEKALYYINKAIDKFPNRLDIRFGKCYMLGQLEDYTNFTKTIIETVEYSQVNKNNWLWTENEKKEHAEGFMLGAVHEYIKQLYDTEDDNLLPNMIEIGERTLKYYPQHIEILSTTAVALMLTKNPKKAIGYLKQAEKLNPQDYIVLNNIAQAYKMNGERENAIRYYELTEKYGDQRAKEQARKYINELRK